jgi:hypothetical protein
LLTNATQENLHQNISVQLAVRVDMFSSTFQNSLAKGSTVLWHKTAAKRPDEIHCPHGENRSHVNNLSTST